MSKVKEINMGGPASEKPKSPTFYFITDGPIPTGPTSIEEDIKSGRIQLESLIDSKCKKCYGRGFYARHAQTHQPITCPKCLGKALDRIQGLKARGLITFISKEEHAKLTGKESDASVNNP